MIRRAMANDSHGLFEGLPGGGQRLVLHPIASRTAMGVWAVVPAGIAMLGLALLVSGRCFQGLLVSAVGAATTVVAVRTFFRKDQWELRAGAATRNRQMLGMTSRLEVPGVQRVVAKAFTDDDGRKNLQVGLQHAGGWVQVGDDFDHDERAEALAKSLSEALGVGLELPPRG